MQDYFYSPDSLLASFSPGNESGRLILVSGESGAGKTHWCQALHEGATRLGLPVKGLISPPILVGGQKTGIDLVDLSSGEHRQLANVRGDEHFNLYTGKWSFDISTLAWGNQILAGCAPCRLLILDELGPLELEAGQGLKAGLPLLDGRHYELACVVVRPSLLENALARWLWGEIFMVPSRKEESAA